MNRETQRTEEDSRAQLCFAQWGGMSSEVWVWGGEESEKASDVRGRMEGWKHRESKQGTLAPNNSYLKKKKKTWVRGQEVGQSPELPGDALCNCWFMYRAGPAACEVLEVKGQVLAISSSYHCASAVPGFVNPEAYVICRGLFKKKNTTFINGELNRNVNIYLTWKKKSQV